MMTTPTDIRLHRKSGLLVLAWADGSRHELSAEFLRVNSPSAEVRGHGRSGAVLQTGKRHVGILDVEQVGNYAVKLIFDDRHASGLFSWEYLYHLCLHKQVLWEQYLGKLSAAGASRDPAPSAPSLSEKVQVINIQPLPESPT